MLLFGAFILSNLSFHFIRIPLSVTPKEFKRGIGSLFDACVNLHAYRAAAGYCSSRMEASYCTLRDLGLSFSMICARYHYHVIHCAITNNEYACVIWVYAGKVYSCVTKLFGGLSYEKIRRYNNSPPYMTARWPPQQIPPLNFLGHTRLSRRLHANRGYRLKSLGTDQLSK